MRRLVMAICVLLLVPAVCWAASDWLGGAVTILFNTTPPSSPTATPVPTTTPTPSPGGGSCSLPNGSTAVDPNLQSYACNELKYLYGLTNAGGTNHLIQSAQLQFGQNCIDFIQTQNNNFGGSTSECGTAWTNQTSANGGKPLGAVGIDPSSINQGESLPLLNASTSGGADIIAKYAWGQGAIVVSHTDFPNPIIDWQNSSNPGNVGPAPCPGAGAPSSSDYAAWGSIYDCNNNSGQSWDAYVQSMLTCPQSYCLHNGTATTANSHWNSELSLYVPLWQDLQNNGIPVLVGINQEDDASALWYNVSNIAVGTESALRYYVEGYWEAQGIHNLLYGDMPIDDSGSWPGCAAVDFTGWDNYNIQTTSSQFVYPQYTGQANAASACGKAGMPQVWLEYGGNAGGSYDDMPATLNGADPDVVLINQWSIGLAGSTNDSSIDSSWPALINNAYTEQIGSVSAAR